MSTWDNARAGRGLLALLLVAVATGLQMSLVWLAGPHVPFIFFYPMIALIAWIADFRIGVFASALSTLIAWRVFLSSDSLFSVNIGFKWLVLPAFAAACCFICFVVASLKRSRLANETLRQRETRAREFYQTALRCMGHGVIAIDMKGIVTYINPEAEALLDGWADSARGRPSSEVFRTLDSGQRPVARTSLDLVLSHGRLVSSEQHMVRARGGAPPVPIAEVASPLRDPNGRMTGAVVVFRDISEERRRERTNRVLQQLVEASADAIIGVDRNRLIMSWNRAAQRIFGYAREDIVGHDALTLLPDKLRRADCGLGAPLRAPMATHVQTICLRRDGTHFKAAISSSPVTGPADEITAMSLTVRDIGERRRRERRIHRLLRDAQEAREQADAANQLKDELLATVSHELRTPLNVIYGWVEVLRNHSTEPLQRQAIDAIDRSARSLAHMVGDILDASSLATGKLRLEHGPVDVMHIADDLIKAHQTTAKAHRITLHCTLPAQPCVIYADAERVRQILSNLLSNAFKFTPAGGEVSVSVSRDGEWVTIVVSDTGKGIPAAFLPHIFDAFRRFEGSPASPRRGLGLGLSIVRHIVELHGGSIAASSPGENLGSLFTVRLPVGWQTSGPHPAPVADTQLAGMHVLEGQRVLLVDDDEKSRASLAAALGTLGAQVRVAASGHQALATTRNWRPTVVLSDLAMADGDGYWLLEQLNARRAPPPVLAVTAHVGRDDRQRVLDAGFRDHISKPVDVQALAQAILDVIARR